MSLFSKLAAHADDRLRERTRNSPKTLAYLRYRLRRTTLPGGVHHVRLPDGFAVVKPGGKRHYVATVLSDDMNPPGRDVTLRLRGRHA